MEVNATLAPGRNGTKQLLTRYGGQLICVRYRYDKACQKRFKPIEIMIDEQDRITGATFPVDKTVPVKTGFEETELRLQMKQAGAYWNLDKKVRMLYYPKVLKNRSADSLGI